MMPGAGTLTPEAGPGTWVVGLWKAPLVILMQSQVQEALNQEEGGSPA